MSSMTKDEVNISLFDEVQRQREEISRLSDEGRVMREALTHISELTGSAELADAGTLASEALNRVSGKQCSNE